MMSKPRKQPQKPFSYKPKYTVPKLGRIKTTWDLLGLYYRSERDPKLQKDIRRTELAYDAFVKQWQKKNFTKTPTMLAKALGEYEALSASKAASSPGRYLRFRTALNAKDSVAEKQLAQLGQRYRKLANKVVFFSLAIGKIPKKQQREFLKHPSLQPYKYYLERSFLSAEHQLSESEEKIVNLKSHQSYGAWCDMTDKIISNRMISFKRKDISLPEALESLTTYSSQDRQALWSQILKELEQIGEVAEHEFNAIITDVRTEEELRGYKKPYSSTALSYQDTETSIENLTNVVSDTGFKLSQKFYKAKAAFHDVDKLHYTQKYDSIGPSLSIPFPQAVDICRDVFYGLDNRYGAIFDRMLTNGQIDVYPKTGKQGGAFMSEQVNQPTHVLLNQTDNLTSLRTLAHEMGHAIHAERGKSQRPFYQGHSITTAETASTLFENLLFDEIYEQADSTQKPILLHDRLTQNIATIQRQIAFFNCELEIHNTITKEGAMTNLELRDCMYRHLKSYLGSAVDVTKADGYSYTYVSHLRYGFYVYTYTFGILMSTIMANHYQADRSYKKQIDTFLSAAESASVADIFKSIGINVSKADTFSEALKNHAAGINDFVTFSKKP